MQSRDYALVLLKKAAQHEFATLRLMECAESPDEVIAFHPQQAVEKSRHCSHSPTSCSTARRRCSSGSCSRMNRSRKNWLLSIVITFSLRNTPGSTRYHSELKLECPHPSQHLKLVAVPTFH